MIIGIISRVKNFKDSGQLFFQLSFSIQIFDKFYALYTLNVESSLPISSIINESQYLSLCIFQKVIDSKCSLTNTVIIIAFEYRQTLSLENKLSSIFLPV
jgi:hypothetical protein